MTTTFKIALLRAKFVARKNIGRAAQILIAVGVSLQDAARFVLSVLRAARVSA